MSKCKGNIVITIGRTFGSGAREIGKKVAEQLEIPFYDKELLEVQARKGKIAFNTLQEYDEKRASGLLYSAAFNPYIGSGIPLGIAIDDIQVKTIQEVANRGPCVIVGRRADKVLRNKYDTLNVFISAPIEKRIARVSARDGMSEKESKKVIQKADKTRRSFYNAIGEGEWGDAANYHLCIDSGDLGADNAAALILQYLKLKGKIV